MPKMKGQLLNERPSGQVHRPVNSWTDIRFSQESLDSIVGHIEKLGLQSLEGWDAAATSLVERDKVASYGVTDKRINAVDQVQYDSGRGPCLDAIKTGDFQYFDGETNKPGWDRFAETAVGEDVKSVMSFPLKLDGEVIGALNFYSRHRDAKHPGQVEEGWVFAAQTAVAITNLKDFAERGVKVEQLEDGLQARTIIGQATGILMAQDGLTSEEAFQRLVKVSQNANMKLRDIAKKFVDSWDNRKTPK